MESKTEQLTAHVTSMASPIQVIRLGVSRLLIPSSHTKTNAFCICLFFFSSK